MASLKKTLPMALAMILPSVSALLPLNADNYPWQAPGPNDLRSPCPAMNTLANHGVLPRDGRNIDLQTVGDAVLLAYHMPYDTMLTVGSPALKTSTTGNASTFNLNDTAQHMPQEIEHDGSMSRDDAYFGDNLHFSKAAWARTLASWGEEKNTIGLDDVAREIQARFKWSEQNNPNFNATFAKTGALLQLSLMLGNFRTNDVVGQDPQANKTMVRYWFENERLPFEMGWHPQVPESSLTVNEGVAAQIQAIWDRNGGDPVLGLVVGIRPGRKK